MLGVYERFPTEAHRIAYLATATSKKRLQKALIETLERTNAETFELETVVGPSMPDCSVRLEFGIAEDSSFILLEREEASRVLRTLMKEPFSTMDFFAVAQYSRITSGKGKLLRSDYYLIRFTFNGGLVEVRIFHERGPRYITPEDIINLVVSKVNDVARRKMLGILEVP